MRELLRIPRVCFLDSRSKAKERNSGQIMDGVSGAGQVSLFGVVPGLVVGAEEVCGTMKEDPPDADRIGDVASRPNGGESRRDLSHG